MFHSVFKRFNRLSSKLILTFIIIILLLTLVMSAFFSISYSQIAEKELVARNVDMLDVYNDNLSVYLKQLSDFSLECRGDSEVMSFLNQPNQNNYDRQSCLTSWVTSMFVSRSDIQKVSFYLPEINEVYSISKDAKFKIVTIKNVPDYQQANWYQELSKSKTFSYLEPVPDEESSSKTFLRYHRSIIDIQTQKILAVISLTMNYDYFENLFYNRTFENEIFSIFDGQKRLYFSTGPLKISELSQEPSWWNEISKEPGMHGNFLLHSKNDNLQIVFSKNSNNDLWLIRSIPNQELIEPAQTVTGMISIFSLLLLILVIPVIILFTHTITNPLHRLSERMDHVQLEQYELIPEFKQSDETAQLSRHFNDMMVRLNQLLEKEYKSELAAKTAQIKAIEAQLNPHFLYNTLQTISTKALIGNMPEISDMIDMLAMNFRYTIRPETLVPIQDELRFVKNYVLLQKARFTERLNVVYHIEDTLSDKVVVPKLCLQIPVENAIVHGMESTSDKITIVISVQAWKDGARINVHNDGEPIPVEKLESLRAELDSTQYDFTFNNTGIGLINLNACLCWSYGEQNLLKISSSEEQGTDVEILIPRKEERRM